LTKSRPKTATPKSSGDRAPATKPGESYCPEAGDFIWIDLDPAKGHERRGRRPVLVLSPRRYNIRAALCVACPITSQAKGYPFEVAIPEGGADSGGAVLADQMRSISWAARHAEFRAAAPATMLAEVRAKIAALIEIG
jgi:mRNA interferase MazF